MVSWVPIVYSGFYDYPLAFVATFCGKQYLFWRVFDDELDDYPESYSTYLLPNLSQEQIANKWTDLPTMAIASVGSVPISKIEFDASRRKEISTKVFDFLQNSYTKD